MTGTYIAIGIVLVLAIWLIASYNSFVKGRNMVREAFSTMDVFMKKRFDLIPNLVETVKGYAAHESETMQNVISARNNISTATTLQGRVDNENALSNTLKSLFALSEAYPDLKANTNFIDLQNQLKFIELDIANSRKYYNAVVRDYNIKTETFPSVIVASMFGFKQEQLFEIASAERENVKVQF